MKRNYPELPKGACLYAVYDNQVTRCTVSNCDGIYYFIIHNKSLHFPRTKIFSSLAEAKYEFRKYVSYMES